MSDNTLVQLNYVLPEELDDLLQRYCEQNFALPAAVVRHLIGDFVSGALKVDSPLEHPKGRRTTATLPVRLLDAFEAKTEAEIKGTKAAVIAFLLKGFLTPRTKTEDVVTLMVQVPTALLDQLAQEGPPGEILVRWAQLVAATQNATKETTDARTR